MGIRQLDDGVRVFRRSAHHVRVDALGFFTFPGHQAIDQLLLSMDRKRVIFAIWDMKAAEDLTAKKGLYCIGKVPFFVQ
jgi:hypothetical protein